MARKPFQGDTWVNRGLLPGGRNDRVSSSADAGPEAGARQRRRYAVQIAYKPEQANDAEGKSLKPVETSVRLANRSGATVMPNCKLEASAAGQYRPSIQSDR